MSESESLYNNVVSEIRQLSDGELDQQLETAVIQSEKAEMLVCCYLSAVRARRAYLDFGYSNITDYAEARFGTTRSSYSVPQPWRHPLALEPHRRLQFSP